MVLIIQKIMLELNKVQWDQEVLVFSLILMATMIFKIKNKLVNVDVGVSNQDAVNKHQLDVGLQLKPNTNTVVV